MNKISKNLSFLEATYDENAIKMQIINDNPNQSVIDNMKLLAENIYEPICEHFKTPIKIVSMYRSLNLNQALKGTIVSQHCSGQAMDIDMGKSSKINNKMIFDFIKNNLEYDQLITKVIKKDDYTDIHVSFSNQNKKEITIIK